MYLRLSEISAIVCIVFQIIPPKYFSVEMKYKYLDIIWSALKHQRYS